MNKEQIRAWLKERQHLVSLPGISRAAKVPTLVKWVKGVHDGRGYPPTMPDKYLHPLNKIIDKIVK